MYVLHMIDRGADAQPRYLYALTDGSHDRLFAANTEGDGIKHLRKALASLRIAGQRLYCRNGQLAGETYPVAVQRITRETAPMRRAEWLLLVAVERLGEGPHHLGNANRTLGRTHTAGRGPRQDATDDIADEEKGGANAPPNASEAVAEDAPGGENARASPGDRKPEATDAETSSTGAR